MFKIIGLMLVFFVLLYIKISAITNVDNIRKRVHELVQKNPAQLTEYEYLFIAEKILQKKPCNLLIFGVGNDSSLWIDLNKGGRTFFIEDSPIWLEKIKKEIPNIQALLVKYDSLRQDWKSLLNGPKNKLLLNLSAEIMNKRWDIILVDAPSGYSDQLPGRMKSIYTAAFLAHKFRRVYVFVHDCERHVEKIYCRTFLKPKNLKRVISKNQRQLNYYFIP